MEKITPEIIEEAKKYYLDDNFSDFFELFFSGIHEDKKGIEFETWTNGGVNMVHYFRASDGCYFMQFRELRSHFNLDEEIDLHRQDKRYCDAFKIRKSVEDFESYLNYLNKIASLIN